MKDFPSQAFFAKTKPSTEPTKVFCRYVDRNPTPAYPIHMGLHTIALDRFKFDPMIIKNRWLLLAAGDFKPGQAKGAFKPKPYNAMTISWASVGQIWNKPFFQIVVRPSRYTYGLLEKHDGFTLSVFPAALKPALNLLGSRSGRDGDKIAASGLHPIASKLVSAPSFEEAELVVECRKIYWQDIEHRHFLDPSVEDTIPRAITTGCTSAKFSRSRVSTRTEPDRAKPDEDCVGLFQWPGKRMIRWMRCLKR